MLDFTTVVAVDVAHVRELQWTWPTWVRHRGQILEQPLLIICDADLPLTEWESLLGFVDHPHRRLVAWSLTGVSQREKMLTALVQVPGREVQTPWYLQLDTDTIALNSGPWIKDDWFEPDPEGQTPVFVSCPWGYTKPPDAIDRLDAWANQHPAFVGSSPLCLPATPGASCVPHPRITSWCFFGQTEWTRQVASWCTDRLPVASQDTYLWYCAARLRYSFRRIQMKKYGWTHTSHPRKLKQFSRSALAQSDHPCPMRPNQTAKPEEAGGSRTAPTTSNQGVVYLLTGPSHAARLCVSITSLREHYTGPIMVYTTEPQSAEIGGSLAADERLQVTHHRFQRRYRGKNASFLMKLDLLEQAPYEQTVYLDADTLVVGSIDQLFEFGSRSQIVATQFSNWTSDRNPVQGRVERWRSLPVDEFLGFRWNTLIDSALQRHPAVNGGVFGVRAGAELLSVWHNLALLGRETFICDEIALQILLHHFPHRVLDCRWNCSPAFELQRQDVRIWHMHGEKHLKGFARGLWWPRFLQCFDESIGAIQKWCPAGDKRLTAHLREHAPNRTLATHGGDSDAAIYQS